MLKGLNIRQFQEHIIDPPLKAIGLYSVNASNLLLGTALVESNLIYLKQLHEGPALGLFQMEPNTLKDICERYLLREDKKELLSRASVYFTDQPFEDQLLGNLHFSVIMARIRYYMVPEKIPETIEDQALYWKEYYNTIQGKGTVNDYLTKWGKYVKK